MSGSFDNPRSVSKDVQKFSNKFLGHETLLTIMSAQDYATYLSKDVQFVSAQLSKVASIGNVASVGYPSWIISKDVNKIDKNRHSVSKHAHNSHRAIVMR